MKRRLTCVLWVMVLVLVSFSAFATEAEAQEMIKISTAQEMLAIDPTQYTSGNDRIVAENYAEFLLQHQPNGKITPGLVTSYKVSPDGKKIECTLRKGVKFHHGGTLTTKDVKFSYERGIKINRRIKMICALIDRLEIVDDYHFNVYFKKPDVLFIPHTMHFPIVSKSYYDRVGEETFAKQPSGTGPYKFVSYKPGEYIEVERFEGYWGKKPPIKRARFYFIAEETTRVSKLKAGEVDLIQAVPYPQVKEIEDDPNLKVVMLETNHPTRSILMGSKNPKMPWYDKRVRLAMALAIDVKSIIKNLLFGVPRHLPALAPEELGYDPNLKPYGYDPERSKKLLAEAGYPNGFEMTMDFPIGGRVAMARETAEMIANYFSAVGIRTKLVGKETEEMVNGRNKATKPDAVYCAFYTAGMSGGIDPTQPMGFYFYSRGGRPVYTNAEYDELIGEAKSTMDDQKRAELINKAAWLLHNDVAYIPIISNVSVYGMKKNVDFNPTKGINFDYLLVKDMKFK